MKTIIGNWTRMILILMILMNMAGCFDGSSDSSNLIPSYINNHDALGYVLVDTGQVVCLEYSDGHVTCTCSR